jgi:hypothetical protein
MHHLSTALSATVTKHDISGTAAAVIAVVLVVWAGTKIATKVVKALVLLVVALGLAVAAVLLFTRTL